MMKHYEKQLIQNENDVDDRCVEFIVLQDQLPRGKDEIINQDLFIDRRHFCSAMKRHFNVDQANEHLIFIRQSINTPVRGLLQLKQHYKVKWLKTRFWAFLWGFTTFLLLIHAILHYYEIV